MFGIWFQGAPGPRGHQGPQGPPGAPVSHLFPAQSVLWIPLGLENYNLPHCWVYFRRLDITLSVMCCCHGPWWGDVVSCSSHKTKNESSVQSSFRAPCLSKWGFEVVSLVFQPFQIQQKKNMGVSWITLHICFSYISHCYWLHRAWGTLAFDFCLF
jgi:hypothetical protein